MAFVPSELSTVLTEVDATAAARGRRDLHTMMILKAHSLNSFGHKAPGCSWQLTGCQWQPLEVIELVEGYETWAVRCLCLNVALSCSDTIAAILCDCWENWSELGEGVCDRGHWYYSDSCHTVILGRVKKQSFQRWVRRGCVSCELGDDVSCFQLHWYCDIGS